MQGLKAALALVTEEYCQAEVAHGPMQSAHEGYAVLLEEVDELWDEVKKRTPDLDSLQTEAKHVAAMAIRFLVDVCKIGQHPAGCICFECENAQMRREVERQLGCEGKEAAL